MVYSLWKTKHSGKSIHAELQKAVGPEHAMSLRSVQRWCQEFQSGRTALDREPGQGRRPSWSAETLPSKIRELLDEDARMTIREMEARLQTPRSSIFNVMKTELGLSKLSARWVPRLLTDELKQRRVDACQQNLQLVSDCGGVNDFLSSLVTSDETWICHFEPESKEQSKVWAPFGSNPPVKAMASAWKKKIMMTAFFDQHGIVTLDFLEDKATINSDRYCLSLRKMKSDYRNKRRGRSSKNISLLHDNATPHVSRKTQETLAQLSVTTIPHPPYSPDLSPCDFFLFGLLKRKLRGRQFRSREELEKEVKQICHREIKTDEYEKAMRDLIHRWEKCIAINGDYVEKVGNLSDDFFA